MGFSMFDVNEVSGKDLSYLDKLTLHLIQTPEELTEAFEYLSKFELIALDTETEGLSPMHHKIVGLILAPSETESFYFPVRHKVGQNLDEASVIYNFAELTKTAGFILFNSKFDWKMIWYNWKTDFEIAGDAQISAYLLNADLAESSDNSLKKFTKKIFNEEPLELSDYGEYNFAMFDPKEAYKYAAPDGTNTMRLYNYFKPMLIKYNLQKVEWIELNCVKAVGQIELNGVTIDIPTLKNQQGAMLDRIKELEQIMYKMAGHEFDINSTQQLSAVLFDELKLEPPVLHGEPQRGTGKEVLQALEGKHKIIDTITKYREVMKLYNDFVMKLPECISEDSRLHGNLNPMGTRSGRFSASGGFGMKGEKIRANLQQLPKAKNMTIEYSVELPDDCGLDPNGDYTAKELDKLYPEWRTFKQN